MRRRLIAIPIVALAAVTVFGITSTGTYAVHYDEAAASAARTCETKHCAKNTHCCYGCTSSPICVKNGVPCPECTPL